MVCLVDGQFDEAGSGVRHVPTMARHARDSSIAAGSRVACTRTADRMPYTFDAMVFRGQTLGKYRILEPLGSGGFGTVYLAEDTWIDKRVAIKVPHRQNLDFGELLHEPRLLASVSHPNIVSITTAEKQDNVFFIVMEYVPGEDRKSVVEG